MEGYDQTEKNALHTNQARDRKPTLKNAEAYENRKGEEFNCKVEVKTFLHEITVDPKKKQRKTCMPKRI